MLRVLVIGGDGRMPRHQANNATIRAFGSSQYGNGNTRDVVASIRNDGVDVVLLLVRWLGHPERHTIVAACRAAEVPCIHVRGGMSAVKEALTAYTKAQV